MHSVNADRGTLLSPKKRSLSRGMSEDESLRSIISTESETPPRRLTRSDSRADTLKRTARARSGSQHSDPDLYLELPDMVDLQVSYEEVVQELRGLEVERETLLFQVDVLQDTLEGTEELLAEAQREALQAGQELQRERDTRRKLEAMVHSLMEEMETIKQERNSTPASPDNTTLPGGGGGGGGGGGEETMMTQQTSASAASSPLESQTSSSCSSSSPTKLQRMARGKSFEQSATLALDSPTAEEGVLRRACDEEGVLRRACDEEGVLRRACDEEEVLRRACDEEGVLRRPCDDNDTDSVSTYEDASAETPEMDRMFPPPSPSSLDDEGDVTVTSQGEEGEGGSPSSPDSKNPNESCVVS